ncbi:MAG: signal transduction protein [Verrucomicrobia bacterium]|nr:signal transduction protein [Verrucomicrobiota bacterium]
MQSSNTTDEARRLLEICNACRYCEGFCAVFPAIELRRSFTNGDLNYLANLCHNCRGCYYACQYAPPHEFAINLPKTLAELRGETYVEYAWPKPFAVFFKKNGTVVSIATALGIAAVFLLTAGLQSPQILKDVHTGPGAFYKVIPEGAMIGVALGTTGFAILAMVIGAIRFWRDTGGGKATGLHALATAARDVLTLRYLGGAGDGCNNRDEQFSQTRRVYHHALFYGFTLCMGSTTVAAIYDHILGWPAPYAFLSVPVLLGTFGGIGMMIGTAGLYWLKLVGDQTPTARKWMGSDYALLMQLFLAAATGLALLVFRSSSAMGALLALHLGIIFSFFAMMPYSKFVHGVYRSAALLRYAHERRNSGQPEVATHS